MTSLKPGRGCGRGAGLQGDGVADAGVAHRLDAGDEVAHHAGGQLFAGLPGQPEDAGFLHLVHGAVVHQADDVPGLDLAFKDAAGDHGAPEGVVVGVEDEPGEGFFGAAFGGRDPGDDGLEDLVDADAFLGGAQDDVVRIQAQLAFDLLLDPVHVRGGQVDLVDHRDDGEVVLHGQIEVGHGLGLHALGGVHQQQHPLAGGQGPGDLVGEIHVARGVDEVELVFRRRRRRCRAG